jgi:molybdopterin-guanine dinucleotide biosynthesis protein A
MGRPKALLPYGGSTLGGAVARAVAEAAGTAVLVGNPHFAALLGFPAIPDRFPGEGPLGGILTALAENSAVWNLLAACDMPALSPGLLRGLLDAAEASDSFAVLARGPSGRPEPLCAVYHASALSPLEAAFSRGARSVMDALEGIRWSAVPVTQAACLENINTPEEWAGHAAE